MTRFIKTIVLLLPTLTLWLNADIINPCPEGRYLEQGNKECIEGNLTELHSDPWLPTCSAGMRMKQQGKPSTCNVATPVPSPGLFLDTPCGPSQRPSQGHLASDLCTDMPNTPPFAYAGGNKILTWNEGTTSVLVELSGSSRDMDEDNTTYAWTLLGAPAGSTATLQDADTSQPSFEADQPGIYRVQLVVNDGMSDSEPVIIIIKLNQPPVAMFTGPFENIWQQDFDLNASMSYDPDGFIFSYNWTPSYSDSAINTIPAPDLGTHIYRLTVTDNDGAVSTVESKVIETVMCAGQEDINLTDEVEGTVNIDTVRNNTESCYKIDLSSNNGTEKYAFYMNLFEGTANDAYKDVSVTMYDTDGTLVYTFNTSYMDYNSNDDPKRGHMKEQFEIDQDGIYYFKISRASNYAANYKFSIHPSLENGLVQDSKGEINDFKEMATPLTLDENNTLEDVSGTLNITRLQDDTSLKYTDDADWYSIDIQDPGKYAFYMNLFNGTRNYAYKDMVITIYGSNGEVHNFDTSVMDYNSNDDPKRGHMKELFTITDPGKYYIYIHRETGYAANYKFSIHPSLENGLVQDSEGEINDFKEMATPLTLNADNSLDLTNGSVNRTRQNDNTSLKYTDDTDWYSFVMSSTGTYTFTMDLTTGTDTSYYKDIQVIMYDQYGQVHSFDTQYMDAEGDHMDESFDITDTGKYYIYIYREGTIAAKYSFSINPSL